MAKKRKRRRASMITKAINVGVLLLAFSRPLQLLLAGASGRAIAQEASMGLSEGRFDQTKALAFYGPMVGAYVLKKAISMIRRTARV